MDGDRSVPGGAGSGPPAVPPPRVDDRATSGASRKRSADDDVPSYDGAAAARPRDEKRARTETYGDAAAASLQHALVAALGEGNAAGCPPLTASQIAAITSFAQDPENAVVMSRNLRVAEDAIVAAGPGKYSLLDLPDETILGLAAHCDPRTLCRLRQSCVKIRDLLDSPPATVFWERACVRWERALNTDMTTCKALVPKARKHLLSEFKIMPPGHLISELETHKHTVGIKRRQPGADHDKIEDKFLRCAFAHIRSYLAILSDRMGDLLAAGRDYETGIILLRATEATEATFRFMVATSPGHRRNVRQFVSQICTTILDIILVPRIKAQREERWSFCCRVIDTMRAWTGDFDADYATLIAPGAPAGSPAGAPAGSGAAAPPRQVSAAAGAPAPAQVSTQLKAAVEDGRAVANALKNGWIPLDELCKANGAGDRLCWRLPEGALMWRLPSLMLPDTDSETMSAARTAFETIDAEPDLVKHARMRVLRSACETITPEEAMERYAKDGTTAVSTEQEQKYRRYVEAFGSGDEELAARIRFVEREMLTPSACFSLVLHEAAGLYGMRQHQPGKDNDDAAQTNVVFAAVEAAQIGNLMHSITELIAHSGDASDSRAIELLLNATLLTHPYIPKTGGRAGDGSDSDDHGHTCPTHTTTHTYNRVDNGMAARLLDARIRGTTSVRYPTRSSVNAVFDATPHLIRSQFGVEPGWRVNTPLGDATVIGLRNKQLWFHVDSDAGASFWKNDVDAASLKKRGVVPIQVQDDQTPLKVACPLASRATVVDLLCEYIEAMPRFPGDAKMEDGARASYEASDIAKAATDAAARLECRVSECDFADDLLGQLIGKTITGGSSTRYDPALYTGPDNGERPLNAVEWFGAWSTQTPEARRKTWLPAVLFLVAREAAAATMDTEVGTPGAKANREVSLPACASKLAAAHATREVVLPFAHWAADTLRWPWLAWRPLETKSDLVGHTIDAGESHQRSIEAGYLALWTLLVKTPGVGPDDLNAFREMHGAERTFAEMHAADCDTLFKELTHHWVDDAVSNTGAGALAADMEEGLKELQTGRSIHDERVFIDALFSTALIANRALGDLAPTSACYREHVLPTHVGEIAAALYACPWGGADQQLARYKHDLTCVPMAFDCRDHGMLGDFEPLREGMHTFYMDDIDPSTKLVASFDTASLEATRLTQTFGFGRFMELTQLLLTSLWASDVNGDPDFSQPLLSPPQATTLVRAAAASLCRARDAVDNNVDVLKFAECLLLLLDGDDSSAKAPSLPPTRDDAECAAWVGFFAAVQSLLDAMPPCTGFDFSATEPYHHINRFYYSPVGAHNYSETQDFRQPCPCPQCFKVRDFLKDPVRTRVELGTSNMWSMHDHVFESLGFDISEARVKSDLKSQKRAVVSKMTPLQLRIEGAACAKRVVIDKLDGGPATLFNQRKQRVVDWLRAVLGQV